MAHPVAISRTAVRRKLSVGDAGMAFRRDRSELSVLEGISLDVREGEFVCLLGPSGCGKSTLLPWLTVEGNIGFGLFRLSRRERAGRIEHYVRMVGLTGFERSYPHELSGGMKQRLEVARAHAVNPDMLFLDEPFGALDSSSRRYLELRDGIFVEIGLAHKL